MSDLFTIGHSTHSIEHFVDLLKRHEIGAIADVRSVPASRFTPQFNRESLKRFLATEGIHYVFLGKELGARSTNPDCYVDGKVQYARLAQTAEFGAGIHRLLNGASGGRIAIMCSEQEPLDCHRTILVSRVLSDRGMAVSHIHAKGDLETHADAMSRLIGLHGLGGDGVLEMPGENRLELALAQQEDKIAYVDKQLVAG